MNRNRSGPIGSVAGTLRVLEVLGEAGGPLALGVIAQRVVRPKSTVHRMLASLVRLGYVEQASDARYRLTLKLWRLGITVPGSLDLVRTAQPHLEALMGATDETVHLAVLESPVDIVYVAKVESPRSIRVQTQLGRLTPSWCTATGRALLAFLPAQRERALAGELPRRTPATIVDPAALAAVLDEVARVGYAVTRGENHPEMGGIAAPVRDHTGAVVAACGIAVPIFRMDAGLIRRCAPMVVGAAEAVSRALGDPQEGRGRRGGWA